MSFWLSENPVEIESDEKNEIRAVSCNIFHYVSYASSETNLGFLFFFFFFFCKRCSRFAEKVHPLILETLSKMCYASQNASYEM